MTPAGESWYQARLNKGHDFTMLNHKRIPDVVEPTADLPLETLANQLTYDADLDDHAERSINKELITRLMQMLPQRERRILELRYGFDGEPWTREQVGHELDCTTERIRQLEVQAFTRLKGQLAEGIDPPLGHSFQRPKLYIDLSHPIPPEPRVINRITSQAFRPPVHITMKIRYGVAYNRRAFRFWPQPCEWTLRSPVADLF